MNVSMPGAQGRLKDNRLLRIEWHRRAIKEFRDLPKTDRQRITEKLEAYAADPDNPRHGVLALVGEKRTCRLRVGDWRVLFDWSDDVIDIPGVRHRLEAYR